MSKKKPLIDAEVCDKCKKNTPKHRQYINHKTRYFCDECIQYSTKTLEDYFKY